MTVADARTRAVRDAEQADEDVLRNVAKLRADLDAVEVAILAKLRVQASVSGSSFMESTALDAARSITARQTAHDVVALLDRIEA
jgi:hypothetical protein